MPRFVDSDSRAAFEVDGCGPLNYGSTTCIVYNLITIHGMDNAIVV